jgi:hypothetical protein
VIDANNNYFFNIGRTLQGLHILFTNPSAFLSQSNISRTFAMRQHHLKRENGELTQNWVMEVTRHDADIVLLNKDCPSSDFYLRDTFYEQAHLLLSPLTFVKET